MAAKQSTDSRAVCLVRFSPRPNPEEANSLDVQEERIRLYADREGLQVVEVFRDPETSARRIPLAKRKGGAAMIDYIQRHRIKHVIIAKLDRAFRDTIDGLSWLKRWKKQGVSLHVAELGVTANCDTANGELVITFLLGVAAFEPRQTAERTSASMKHRQQHGQRMSGHLKFGKMLLEDGSTADDPLELELARRMDELRHVYSMSLRDIAAHLNAEGHTFRGKRITKSAVSAGLRCQSSVSSS